MMTKSLIAILFLALFAVLVQAQETTTRRPSERDRQLCLRIVRRCTENVSARGQDDGVDSVNRQCRNIRGPQWREVNRCQLLRAHCELSVIRCSQLSCLNIERIALRPL